MGADSLRTSPRKGEETVLSGARTPFYPGYFAAVMATGILSTALHLYHQAAWSDGLMAVAILAYLGLAYVYGRRAVRAPQDMWQDLKDPSRAFGFFTIVAGSNVLAVRVLLADWMGAAVVLGAVALLVWAVLFYTIMTVLITGPAIDVTAVNGGWLIAIVAEQSIATLLASLVDALPQHAAALFLLSTTFWAMGLIFYVVFIGLIMNRLIFQRVGFGDLQPPYWINMGAAAITVLASSRLLSVHVQAPIPAPVSRGRDPDAVGLGELVDSPAADSRCVEILVGPRAHTLPSLPVEHRLPARHVRHGHDDHGAHSRVWPAARDWGRLCVGGAGCLAVRVQPGALGRGAEHTARADAARRRLTLEEQWDPLPVPIGIVVRHQRRRCRERARPRGPSPAGFLPRRPGRCAYLCINVHRYT